MKGMLLIVIAANAIVCAPSYASQAAIFNVGLYISRIGTPKVSYRAPNGTYYSYSGYIRSVNGTPCGVECGPPLSHAILFASPPGYECFVTGTRNRPDR